MKKELVIIGGGPAGLAAALAAYSAGVRDVLIIERDHALGGILNQCIHNGFGLHRFQEELTGPEYAEKYVQMLKDTSVCVWSDTMVIHLTEDKQIHCVSPRGGYRILSAGAVILAMGCRERTRGAIALPGSRCSGVFTAGAAQRYLNLDGYLPGKRVVILGSGDIGLIMARRMTLEGAKVLAVVELMPYSNGLNRNIVQCLQDYDIPLYLSHTVTDIKGKARLEKVVVSQVDENGTPIKGTERELECDTLLLSVGLIPENELSREAGIHIDPRTGGPVVDDTLQTTVTGVFACGNVLHVHDLVDYVSMEAEQAGRSAAQYLIRGEALTTCFVEVLTGEGIRYTVPQRLRTDAKEAELSFRVSRVMEKAVLSVYQGEKLLHRVKRSHLHPSEMAKLKLTEEWLKHKEQPLRLVAEEAV